jgi:hypothetical protein
MPTKATTQNSSSPAAEFLLRKPLEPRQRESRYLQRRIPTIMGAMRKPPRNKVLLPRDGITPPNQRKPIPYVFVLDAIAHLPIETRPMFGSLAVYLGDKIVFILRHKRDDSADNGVWLATTVEHHESLQREFPCMRSIQGLGKALTGWQVLPADAPDFEESAFRACELVGARDPRIGKVPKSRQKPQPQKAAKKARPH